MFAGEDVAADLAAALRWPATGSFAVAVSRGRDEIAERLRRRRGAADFAWLAQDDTRRASSPVTRDRPGRRARRRGRAPAALSAPFSDLARPRATPPATPSSPRCAPAREPTSARSPPSTSSAAGALVADLWDASGRPLPPRPILVLTTHRRGDQLFEALDGLPRRRRRRRRAAAKRCSMHRASLYRRIERVEHLTGLDLAAATTASSPTSACASSASKLEPKQGLSPLRDNCR